MNPSAYVRRAPYGETKKTHEISWHAANLFSERNEKKGEKCSAHVPRSRRPEQVWERVRTDVKPLCHLVVASTVRTRG